MPKCNTMLQTENDLFEPEIQPNSPGNFQFRPFFSLKNHQKVLDILQLIDVDYYEFV